MKNLYHASLLQLIVSNMATNVGEGKCEGVLRGGVKTILAFFVNLHSADLLEVNLHYCYSYTF